ncbi:MAG: hypothetical protein LAO04_22260 [Acidobacteriia bacterium]|nr:hypothetical protein [Terriglobia bacterium]
MPIYKCNYALHHEDSVAVEAPVHDAAWMVFNSIPESGLIARSLKDVRVVKYTVSRPYMPKDSPVDYSMDSFGSASALKARAKAKADMITDCLEAIYGQFGEDHNAMLDAMATFLRSLADSYPLKGQKMADIADEISDLMY